MAKKKKKEISEETLVAEDEVTSQDKEAAEAGATPETEAEAAAPQAEEETKAEGEAGAGEEEAKSEEAATVAAEVKENRAEARNDGTAAAAEAAPKEEAAEAEEPTETAGAEPALKEQLELARQEAGQNLENWQRAAAELANFKRRQAEQLKLQRDRIKGELLAGVISALDDMDLAFQNVPEDIDGRLLGWVEGFRLVQRKLDKILEEQNVMYVKTDGQFDPNFHEAVSHEDSDEHEEGEIIAELRKGYQIGSRVLRPALVRVAK